MRLLFLGDYCISGTSKPNMGPNLSNLLGSADVIGINFEGPIHVGDLSRAIKAGPSISQSSQSLEFIKSVGATHFCLANNHIMDFGLDGFRETLKKFKANEYFGASLNSESIYKPSIINGDEISIGLLAFSEAQFGVHGDVLGNNYEGVARVDHPLARKAVQDAKRFCDRVIVQVHAGLEMVDLPLPEWRNRYRELVELGADLVIGHHPHVLQGAESYKGSMIYYSIGNFYMDFMFDRGEAFSGGLVEVTVDSGGFNSRLIPLKSTIDLVDLDLSITAQQVYKSLCDRLSNIDSYLLEVQKICDHFWEHVYTKYYEVALNGFGVRMKFSKLLKNAHHILRNTLRRRRSERENYLLLLHNIQIESHRWAVERAIWGKLFK